MLLIPSAKLAMLYPWKTASQTLQSRLEALGTRPYPKLHYFNQYLHKVVHQHLTLADYRGLPQSQLGYELAVFVRNPYDRVFSGFQQALRDISVLPRLNYPQPWIRELVMQQVASLFSSLSRAQYNVDQWFQQLSLHEILDTGHSTCMCLHPVTYWTHQAGEQVADFIGKVEDFESDFSRLRERYSLPMTAGGSENRSDPTLARPDANNYLYTYRLHPRTIAKINDVFRDDFDLLGYERLSPAKTA